MISTSDDIVIRTSDGAVRGRRTPWGSVFRGIPFAQPPTGELRLAPPAPTVPWTGVRDALEPGAASPQPASRLERVVGPLRLKQSEDCLFLEVWTPGVEGDHPVMVFLHGGGFSSGTGGQDWYEGTRLAERGVVVVNVNYRVGALGYLYLADLADDMSAGNLALLDQLAGLRWVQRNISAFGGDPGRVTLAGQSAGALSTIAMSGSPFSEGLFQRVILQSPPGGVLPAAAEDATSTAERFLHRLGLRPNQAARLRSMPVDRLLSAQVAVARDSVRFMDPTPPFQLVADGALVTSDIVGAAEGRFRSLDVLLGSTHDEGHAFYALDPRVREIVAADAVEVVQSWYGDGGTEVYARHAGAMPGATPGDILSGIADEHFLDGGVRRLVDWAAHGYVYRFDWHSGSPFAACHCIELPFVYGTLHAWREAPMLTGGRPVPMSLVDAVQDAWAAFVHTGSPRCDALPTWPAHQPGGSAVMRLDDPPLMCAGTAPEPGDAAVFAPSAEPGHRGYGR